MRCCGETRYHKCQLPSLMIVSHCRQVEYLVVAYDDATRRADLSLRQADILVALAKDEELCKQGGCVPALQSLPRRVITKETILDGDDH